MNEDTTQDHNIPIEEIRTFWFMMCNKKDESYDQYLCEYILIEDLIKTFPSFEEFQQIVKYLPNWKAAGPDRIYNYFIKKCESLHEPMYKMIKEMCLNEKEAEEWFYKGIIYLISEIQQKEATSGL